MAEPSVDGSALSTAVTCVAPTSLEEHRVGMDELPRELLVKIISYLNLQAIHCLEQVCSMLRDLIAESIQLWKQKIKLLCRSHRQYANVLDFSAYASMEKNAANLRKFMKCLARVNKNIRQSAYTTRTLHCMETKVAGRRVVMNPDWYRSRNYRGVYDMVFDQGRICCSVYDTIQIWDTRTYELTNMFTKEILDSDHSLTSCFSLYKDYLICGTDNGYIKVFDAKTEQVLTRNRVNSNYISDVKMKGDRLMALDWFGNITYWKVCPGPKLAAMNSDEDYEVPGLLNQRHIERLMDFGDEFLIATYKCHITYYKGKQFVRSLPVHSDVFCIDIKDHLVGFGCKGAPQLENQNNDGFLAPVAGLINFQYSPPRIVYIRTEDNDAVISIQLTSRFLFLGDVNGELHIFDVERIKFTADEVTVNISDEAINCIKVGRLKTHDYRDFIWALKFDGFRLFSGDDTGRIIVHDFLSFDHPEPESSSSNAEPLEASPQKCADTEAETEDQSKNEKETESEARSSEI